MGTKDLRPSGPVVGQLLDLALSSRLNAGSTPFPYNPLTMRLPTGLVAAAPPPPPASVPQGNSNSQHHGWEEEPKPLLVSQYETLSDSE